MAEAEYQPPAVLVERLREIEEWALDPYRGLDSEAGAACRLIAHLARALADAMEPVEPHV